MASQPLQDGTKEGSMLRDKVILVTGGTGSFGKKFTAIMLRDFHPKKLIIFSRDELKQHEMRQVYPDTGNSPMRYFIGDVRDHQRLFRAFHGVDIVVHAAALKQVPACEYNPLEAVRTNIDGAANVIDAAIDNNVEKVMAISTDKAVHPVNLYGATKLVAEKLFVQANAYTGERAVRFGIARYGNVIGSRGSVIPLFAEQRKSGKVTITDERMTRFWLTLEQGVHFVMSCIDRMRGGEIFVPKIPSMRLMDLADAIAPDAQKEITGIRPGEKINEVLLTEEEACRAREFEDHFVIEPEYPFWDNSLFTGGKKLSKGFRYASDNNQHWLRGEELRKMIEEVDGQTGD